MQPVFEKIAAVAASEAAVLLVGESGTGKELRTEARATDGVEAVRRGRCVTGETGTPPDVDIT